VRPTLSAPPPPPHCSKVDRGIVGIYRHVNHANDFVIHNRSCNASLDGPFVAAEEARGGCKFNSAVDMQRDPDSKVRMLPSTLLECTRWTCEFGPEEKQPLAADPLPEGAARYRASSKKVRCG
jgi:hypothetical protein